MVLVAGHAHAAPDRLADIPLDTDERQCAFLGGCPEGKPLTLASLPGDFLFIEVFSMYCPICQGEADKVNELYDLISKSEFADKFGFVGIGAGNSRFEAEFFQEKYKVPFPMFPDQDMAFYNTLGEPGTPFFILAKKDGDGLKVLFTHVGPFGDPAAFERTLLKKAGVGP